MRMKRREEREKEESKCGECCKKEYERGEKKSRLSENRPSVLAILSHSFLPLKKRALNPVPRAPIITLVIVVSTLVHGSTVGPWSHGKYWVKTKHPRGVGPQDAIRCKGVSERGTPKDQCCPCMHPDS